ncbi:MAG: PAS domain-containing protein [Desulforhopalus sp.]|jgi:PAS domain-containing protein
MGAELFPELEQLQVTENRYRTILNNSSDAIFRHEKKLGYLFKKNR